MNVQFDHATLAEPMANTETQVFPRTDAPEGNLPQQQHDDLPRILAELVIEEVSIDGMCGVY